MWQAQGGHTCPSQKPYSPAYWPLAEGGVCPFGSPLILLITAGSHIAFNLSPWTVGSLGVEMTSFPYVWVWCEHIEDAQETEFNWLCRSLCLSGEHQVGYPAEVVPSPVRGSVP